MKKCEGNELKHGENVWYGGKIGEGVGRGWERGRLI